MNRLTMYQNDQWVISFRVIYDLSKLRHYLTQVTKASKMEKLRSDTKNGLKIRKIDFFQKISKPTLFSLKNFSKPVFWKIRAWIVRKLLKFLTLFSKASYKLSKSRFKKNFNFKMLTIIQSGYLLIFSRFEKY